MPKVSAGCKRLFHRVNFILVVLVKGCLLFVVCCLLFVKLLLYQHSLFEGELEGVTPYNYNLEADVPTVQASQAGTTIQNVLVFSASTPLSTTCNK